MKDVGTSKLRALDQWEFPGRDKKKTATLSIHKTELITSVYVNIEMNGSSITKKLFDKNNVWWYDCVYILSRHNKWFDSDKFWISYHEGLINAWYSIKQAEVNLFENGNRVSEIDFKKYFFFG